MPSASDVAKTIRISEQDGVVTEVVRTVRVDDLTSGDITNLSEALTALDSAGLTYYSTTAVDSGLRLVDRQVELMGPNSPDKGMATLTYRNLANTIGAVGQFVPSISSSLNSESKTTDIFGLPVTTSYTYPSDDEQFPGQTKSKGHNVRTLLPQAEVTYRGLLQLNSPMQWILEYLGRTNDATWNQAPRDWMLCSGVEVELHDQTTTPVTWRITLTFQMNPSTWKERVHYEESRGIPSDLVYGVGIKNIQTQPRRDFNEIIDTRSSV